MAISPYSTPLQYEYKPLNLSGFMVPLAKMQEDFDATTSAVNEADFNIANLPYGTDPEKAKELMATVKAKRDELAQNLATTKNYRQAASKLKQLNTLWNKDPHKLALEGEAKRWEEAKKRELARVKEGKISKEKYEQWERDEVRKYDTRGGASFKADYSNEEGNWNHITGDTGRYDDIDKEYEDMQQKLAGAMKARKDEGWYKAAGIDSDTFTKHFRKSAVSQLTDEEIARDVENYLREQPRFKRKFIEDADYNFKDLQYSKNFKEHANQIVNQRIATIDKYLPAVEAQAKKDKKSIEDDPTYQRLIKEKQELQNASTTGEYDVDTVKNIYINQELNKNYDMSALGDIYEQYERTTSEKGEKIDKDSEAAGGLGMNHNKGLPFIGAAGDMKFDTPSIHKRVWDNANSIKQTTKSLFDVSKGALGKLVLGEKAPDSGVGAGIFNATKRSEDSKFKRRVDLENNAGAQYERLSAVQQAIGKSRNFAEFKTNLKKSGITDFDDATAKQVYTDLSDTKSDALAQLNNGLQQAEGAYTDYVINKTHIKNIEESTYRTKEFQRASAEIGSLTPTVKGNPRTIGQTGEKVYEDITPTSFYATSYPKDKLRAKGINPDKKKLTFDDVAKLNGYKNYQDAVQKGYNFKGITTSTKIGDKTYTGTPQEIKSQIVKDMAHKGLEVEKMSNKYINDVDTEKELAGYFKNIDALSTKAKASDLRNLPGFDEKGTPLSGTKIVKDYKPQLVTLGGETYFSVPYTYANTVDGKKVGQSSALIKAKPEDINFLKNAYGRVINKAKKDSSPLAKETLASTRVALFNINHGNKFNDVIVNSPTAEVYISNDPATREREITNISIPHPSGRTLQGKIVKAIKGNNSTDVYYTVKYSDGSYLGEEFKTPDALKSAITEYEGQ
jgi:hypothetical protein